MLSPFFSGHTRPHLCVRDKKKRSCPICFVGTGAEISCGATRLGAARPLMHGRSVRMFFTKIPLRLPYPGRASDFPECLPERIRFALRSPFPLHDLPCSQQPRLSVRPETSVLFLHLRFRAEYHPPRGDVNPVIFESEYLCMPEKSISARKSSMFAPVRRHGRPFSKMYFIKMIMQCVACE